MSAVARSYQTGQEAIARRTAATATALWRQMDVGGFDESWAAIEDRVFVAVSAGQSTAAARTDDYLDALLASQGVQRRADGAVNSRAVSGVASDGRPLDTLLRSPLVRAKIDVLNGFRPADALDRSGRRMMMLSATQTLDAGRHGMSAGMAASPDVKGYRRQVQSGACARCSILAGKWYRSADPFLRHPFCACSHVPAIGPSSDLGGLEGFDPQAQFDGLSVAEQDRIYTKAGADAIRDGADMSQVVNARRGMKTTSMYGRKVSTTTAGSNAPGVRAPRLMPEQIYRDATSREDAVRLLRRHGYLT